ncbi:ROK family protein [Pseudarthrobacter sp. DSP2-3-2b1]|uniref:ROK family protein n=1 Tax=Pseudarthrobacter sp. DSP2-3-2b1 TaxID=2804661 RepID=UPI003CEF30CC
MKEADPALTTRPRINARAILGKPARQATLRESNLTTVAAHVFATDEPVSRAGIAEASGLTRATVTRIVETLIDARILEELPTKPAGGVGRPVVPLAPARRSMAALGLEVNTATLGACVVDLTGEVLASAMVEGNFIDSEPAATLARLNRLAGSVLDEAGETPYGLVGAHLSLPGIIDESSGALHVAPLLGWRNIHPRQLLGDIGSIPSSKIQLGSVGAVASVAEATLRHQDGSSQNFLYVAGDNALGCFLVVNGEPLTGMSGWSGNVGHTVIDPNGQVCRCGARGCLDTYIGRRYLLAQAGFPPNMSLDTFLAQASAGENARITASLERAGVALGEALADLINFCPVKTIVLADNLAQLFPWIRRPVEDQLKARVSASEWFLPTLEVSRTSRHAAMRGGALTVLQGVIADLHSWLETKEHVLTAS